MAIQKVELSSALNSLATQSSIDKVTGMLGGAAANISKADLATVVADLMKGIVAFKYGTISSLSAGGYYDLQIDNGGILIINHNGTGTCVACVVTYGGVYPIGKTRHVSVAGNSSISDSGKVNIDVSKERSGIVRITTNIELSHMYYLLLGEKSFL